MENFMRPRICIVGAGSISPFHIEAAEAAGFELFAICARPDSNRARLLYKRFGFKKLFSDLSEIESSKPDAIAILSNTENLFKIYQNMKLLQVPILIEKPVVNSIYEFPDDVDLDCNDTLIGYNRRFYSSVQFVKKHLNEVTPANSNWTISELSSFSDSKNDLRIKAIRENAVHILDLMAYLFGSVKNISTERIFDSNGIKFISSLVKFNSGAVATINLSLNSPNLYGGKILTTKFLLQLKPIEILEQYSRIEIFDPNKDSLTRRYKLSGPNWKIDQVDLEFKAGFYKQYTELKNLVEGIPRVRGATLRDAKYALTLAEALLDSKFVSDSFSSN